MMLPPLPPSPPEGPPRGTYFSLRKATQPFPPSPPFIEILASSANMGHLTREGTRIGRMSRWSKTKADDGTIHQTRPITPMNALVRSLRSRCLLGARGVFFAGEDTDEATLAALVFKQHEAVNQGEKRIVLRAGHVLARLVMRATLAD